MRPLTPAAVPGDAEPGDTTGQGVQGVWWVVGPDGAWISDAARPDDMPAR